MYQMYQKTFTPTILMLALMGLHAPVFAADESQTLETVEVKAVVGTMNKLGDVPFKQAKSAIALSAEKMAEEGVAKADEMGRYQAGFTNQPYGSDTNTNWFKIRGTDASQAFDGAPAVSHGFFQPTMATYGLEAVEITKGADSVAFGASNAGGLINYVSKRPHKNLVNQGEVKAHLGDKNQRGISADYTGGLNADHSLRYRVVGTVQQSDGEWKGTDSKTYYFAPSLAWDISNQTKLNVLASVQQDKGTPSSNFVPQSVSLMSSIDGQKVGSRTNLGDPSVDKETNKQYSLGYELSHELQKGLVFSQNYKYNQVDNKHLGVYVWSNVSNQEAQRDAVYNNGKTKSHSIDNRVTWRMKNQDVDNTLVAGVDYRHQKTQGNYSAFFNPVTPSMVNVFRPSYGVSVNTANAPRNDMTSKQLGFYLQNQTKLFKKIGLTAGIRHDRVDNAAVSSPKGVKQNHTSYSASAMYYAPYGLNPYFSYSEAFSVPLGLNNDQALYDPQTTKQYEIGLKYLPSWLDGSISVAAFKAKDTNALVATNGKIASATDSTKRQGVEIQANAQMTDNVHGQFAYTYQKRTDTASGVSYNNPLFARHSASARAVYQFNEGQLNGLAIGAGLRYVGNSTIDGQWASNKGAKVPAYTVGDVFARYQFAHNWTAQLNVDNISNKKYLAACDGSYCYYGQGRNINASISYKF